MNSFSTLHTRWLPAMALLIILASSLVVLRPVSAGLVLLTMSLASLPLMLWGLHVATTEQAMKPAAMLLRPANMITLARLCLAVLAGLLAALHGVTHGGLIKPSGTEGLGPFAAVIAILVCLSFIMDGLDGQAARLEARKAGKSGLPVSDIAPRRAVGAWLDMETDSLLFYLYSLLLVVRTPVPTLFLSVGLFRYVFGVLFSLPPWNLRPRPLFSWTAKSIAAVAEVCLCILFLLASGLLGAAGPTATTEASWSQWLWSICVYLPVALLAFSFATEGLLRLYDRYGSS